MTWYRLNDERDPVPCTRDEGARYFSTADRTVAKDLVGNDDGRWEVSTVFLGLDHGHDPHGRPLLFETMVFSEGTRNEEYVSRYATWGEAEAGHAYAVSLFAESSDGDEHGQYGDDR